MPQGAIAIVTFVAASILGRKPGDVLTVLIGRCIVFAIFSWVLFWRITIGP